MSSMHQISYHCIEIMEID